MTASFLGEWTAADSAALDAEILRQRRARYGTVSGDLRRPDKERQPRPKTCVMCSRPLRAKGTSPDDHPGTVPHESRGRCSTCAGSVRRDVLGLPRRVPVPEACIDCEITLRPAKRAECEFPGTVEHDSKGRCKACAAKHRNPRKRPDTPTACVDCGHALRPNRRTLAEFPGTLKHDSHGRCSTCARRIRENGTAA